VGGGVSQDTHEHIWAGTYVCTSGIMVEQKGQDHARARGSSTWTIGRGSQGRLAIALSASFLFRPRREEAKIRLRRCHLFGQPNSKMPKFWNFAAFF
jgi:hypothetical protein